VTHPKLIRPPLVEVEWMDAVDRKFSGPVPEAIRRGRLYRRFQAGYLIHQDEEVTLLTQTWDPPDVTEHEEEPQVDALTVIPTKWIVKIRHRMKKRERRKAEAPSMLLESLEGRRPPLPVSE